MNINTLKKLPLINQLRLVAAWFDSLEYANISEIKTLSKGYEITFYSRQEDEQETIIFKNIKQLQIFVNQNLSYSDLLEVYNEDENIIFRKREKNKNEN